MEGARQVAIAVIGWLGVKLDTIGQETKTRSVVRRG